MVFVDIVISIIAFAGVIISIVNRKIERQYRMILGIISGIVLFIFIILLIATFLLISAID